MHIHHKGFESEFRGLYNADKIVEEDGYFYNEVQKQMYSLKQVAILVYNQLKPVFTKERISTTTKF